MYNLTERIDNECRATGAKADAETKARIENIVENLESYASEHTGNDFPIFSGDDPKDVDFSIFADHGEIKLQATYLAVDVSEDSDKYFYEAVKLADGILIRNVEHQGDEGVEGLTDVALIFIVKF